MKDFTLTELDEFIAILFERTKDRDDTQSPIEAATRCFYEYESTMRESETGRIACSLIIGGLLYKHGSRIFIGQYNLVLKAANDAIAKQEELDLSTEERIEVVRWANELLKKLPSMEIEHDPRAK